MKREKAIGLTARQLEMLNYIFHGKTNDEIAQCTGITRLTVKNHVQAILRKVGAYNRINLVYKALEAGLITPPTPRVPPPPLPPRVTVKELDLTEQPSLTVLKYRDLEICEETGVVSIKGKDIRMRKVDMKYLLFFLKHPNRVYNREQLLVHVQGPDALFEIRTVDVHIRHIRQILKPYGYDALIHTVHGYGYMLKPLPEEEQCNG